MNERKPIREHPHVTPLIKELHGSSPKQYREQVRSAMMKALLKEDSEDPQEKALAECLRSILDGPYPINRMWRELDMICMEIEHGESVDELLQRSSSIRLIGDRVSHIMHELACRQMPGFINVRVVQYGGKEYRILSTIIIQLPPEDIAQYAFVHIRNSILSECLDGTPIPIMLDGSKVDYSIYEELERISQGA